MTTRPLRMLYREIPATSPCRAGCSDCCGPVPWSAEEFARVEADLPLGSRRIHLFGSDTVENAATGKCAFASPVGCLVYDRRPFMCRLFGAARGAPGLECPHGVRAARPLSAAHADALTDRYRAMPRAQHPPTQPGEKP